MTDHLTRGATFQRAAAGALAPITVQLHRSDGVKPPWEQWINLDVRAVERAAACAHAIEPDEGYIESAANARRRVGLALLACIRDDPGLDPLSAFDRVFSERSDWFSRPLTDWLDALGSGGRGAVAAEACAYAAGVAAWLGSNRLAAVRFSGPSEHLDWELPSRTVRVRGRCDAMIPRGVRPADRRLLVVVGSLDQADGAAGQAALAYTLARGSVPLRVTVLAPATGSVVIDVDDDRLEEALGRVADAARSVVAARFGPEAEPSAGRWCRRCGRAGECEQGDAWLATNPVRFGGLLPSR